MRLFWAFLFTAGLLLGDTFKLYLKDGGYHAVREYQVQQNRIRYFSTERGEWEEIPAELVDLEKTEKERKAKNEQAATTAREQEEEDKAEREQRREIAAIPVESGAYYKQGSGKIDTLKLAEYQIVTDKKRRTLQVLSPIPLVAGKASVVIKGEHAAFEVSEERPDFLLRLEKQERFGILTLTPKKGMRVVEDIAMVPVSKENVQQAKQMDTFQQELASGLYRIWPQKTLAPGEYALVEFSDTTDPNEVALLIWDFAVSAGAKK